MSQYASIKKYKIRNIDKFVNMMLIFKHQTISSRQPPNINRDAIAYYKIFMYNLVSLLDFLPF